MLSIIVQLAMQRSSETIGTIAAALAKAQAQLVNPEKSLVATIRSDGPRGSEQTFRLSESHEVIRHPRARLPPCFVNSGRLATSGCRWHALGLC
jgi:hypothetical protein